MCEYGACVLGVWVYRGWHGHSGPLGNSLWPEGGHTVKEQAPRAGEALSGTWGMISQVVVTGDGEKDRMSDVKGDQTAGLGSVWK